MKELVRRFESPSAYFQEAKTILLGMLEDARKMGAVGIAHSDLIQSYRALVEKAIISAARDKSLPLESTFSFLSCFGEENEDLFDPRPLHEYFAAFNGSINPQRFLALQDVTCRIVDCYGHALDLGEYSDLACIRYLEELIFKPAVAAASELSDYGF